MRLSHLNINKEEGEALYTSPFFIPKTSEIEKTRGHTPKILKILKRSKNKKIIIITKSPRG
jgi:hypothetical protein